MKGKVTAFLTALALVFALLPITATAASFPAKTLVPTITLLEERKPEDGGSSYLYCEFSVPQGVMDVVNEDGEIRVFVDEAVKVDNGEWEWDEGQVAALSLTPYEVIEGTSNKYYMNLNLPDSGSDKSIDTKKHSYSVKLLFMYIIVEGDFAMGDFSAEKTIGVSGNQPPPVKNTVVLDAIIRDFHSDGVLFESGSIGAVDGLVQSKLGSDKKPVFNLPLWSENWPGTTQTMLNALFNDVTGTNKKTTKPLTFTADNEGYYVLDSAKTDGFFPIDGELFGDEGQNHNFWFSLECHAQFTYQGYEEFEFVGDDDVWVFVDGVLVVDIGGVHGAERESISLPALTANGTLDIKKGETVSFDFFYMERQTSESNFYARTNIDFTYAPISSPWATAELQKAADLGLIPETLKTADLTKSITRAEFAAVAVKVYEALSGAKAIPAVNNPFIDTSDVEVLKAYNVGITSGTSSTAFSPTQLLNREQAATMLTRVFKKVSIAGWTLATDGSFKLQYTAPAKFADDAKISAWAKDSVYFMSANGIISGVGSNTFAPRAVTTEEQAKNYASATREQALVIAVRMVENLRDKI